MPGARPIALIATLVIFAGCPGGGSAPAVVRFRVEPTGATTVVLWDAERGLEVRANAAETVELEAPRERLLAPRVVVSAADGSETTSAKLAVSAVTTLVDVGRLRVWPARVGYQREGEKVRFSWSALEGPDVPDPLRYSLIFVYRNTQGQDSEGTLIRKGEHEAILTLSELSEIFPERDPKAKVMTIRIRAYGSSATEGTIWAGPKQDWVVPDDLPLSRDK
jgi:hypothetical protein